MVRRVIDQHVDCAKLKLGFLKQVDTGARISHIHRKHMHLCDGPQFLRDFLEIFLTARNQQQFGTGGCKLACRRCADALGTTRDDYGFVFEVIHPRSLAA